MCCFYYVANFSWLCYPLIVNMETKQKTIFHSRPLFYGFLALMLAMTTSRHLFAGDVKYIVFVSVVIALFVAYVLWSKKFFVLFVTLAVFLFGCGWYFFGIQSFQSKVYEGDSQVCDRVADDLAVNDGYATATLKNVTINGNKEENVKITMFFDDENLLKAGDILVFESSVDNVRMFELGKFRSDYYRDGVTYQTKVNAEDVCIVGNSLSVDEKFRLKMKDSLYSSMGNENGAMAFAVLFGDKSGVEKQALNNYKMSGIVHLLTVSGLHVGFLIALLGFLLKLCRIKRWINLLICSAVLALYAWLCGFAPSILRAGIMGMILLFTKISGKCYDQLNSLGSAGILIVLFSPLSALDVGFQMSFFCVLGVFVVYPLLSNLLRKIFPKFVADSVAVSLASQIGILPFLGQIFSSFNFLSFFINLIVIPLFSILYPILFIGSLLTLIMPFMQFILKFCGFGFSLTNNIASFFSSTNLKISLEPIDIFLVLTGFVLLFLLSRYFMANKKVKIIGCSTFACIFAILGCLSFVKIPEKPTLVYAYNYSTQTVLLTNESGETAVVDLCNENFEKQIFIETGIDGADVLFLLSEELDIEIARAIGVDSIVRCTQEAGFEEEICVPKDDHENIAGFEFCYITFENKLFGLEIKFDQTSIFIVKNALSENAIKSLNNCDYDIVILGKNDVYSSLLDEEIVVLGYYRGSKADVTYTEHGNVCFDIKQNSYNRRCLD